MLRRFKKGSIIVFPKYELLKEHYSMRWYLYGYYS